MSILTGAATSGSVVTGTVTINAAFLQEIKDDNRELRQLLVSITARFRESAIGRVEPRSMADLLENLRDQLAMHFALEEAFGYFEDAVFVAPHLCERAEKLRSQHDALFRRVCHLAESAQRLLYLDGDSPGHTALAMEFIVFHKLLTEHEAAENELIVQALDEDLGEGD